MLRPSCRSRRDARGNEGLRAPNSLLAHSGARPALLATTSTMPNGEERREVAEDRRLKLGEDVESGPRMDQRAQAGDLVGNPLGGGVPVELIA
jgi:hypothetical protein